MPDTGVTIYHNPKCATSRRVLERIRGRGIEPRVIEYLKQPPTRSELAGLLRRMGVGPRAVLRRPGPKGAPSDLDGLADEALIDRMAAEPVLIERPIVVGPGGVRLCRPPESVDAVLGGHAGFAIIRQ